MDRRAPARSARSTRTRGRSAACSSSPAPRTTSAPCDWPPSAAGRVGAGLVTVACPQSIHAIVAAGLVEATYLPLPDKEGGLSEKGVADVLRVLEGYDVMLIGPGLGGRSQTLEFVRSLLFSLKEGHAHRHRRRRRRPQHPRRRSRLGRPRQRAARADAASRRAATPHRQEHRRDPERPACRRHAERRRLATDRRAQGRAHRRRRRRTDAPPSAPSPIPLSPAPAPATSSRARLPGFLAQGLDRFAAAVCGVYLHGMAGERVREALGDAGLQASDLLLELPRPSTPSSPAADAGLEKKPSLPLALARPTFTT